MDSGTLAAHYERVRRALEYAGGTHTVPDVLDAIEREDAQLWVSERGVVVTEVQVYPQMRVLHFWIAAGEMDAVLELEAKALQWGREQGCTRATLAGRRGWERALRDRGWSAELTVMGRPI